MFRLRPEMLRSHALALDSGLGLRLWQWLRGQAGRYAQRWRARHRPAAVAFVSDLADLQKTMLQHRGQSLQLLLSSNLSLQWLGEMPAERKMTPAELQTWLRQQWLPYYGDAVQGWPLAAWRDDTLVGGCALTGLLLPEVLQAAAQEGVRLQAIQPWWAAMLPWASQQVPELARAEQAQWVLVEGMVVTCLLCQRGQLRQIITRRLATPTMQALADVLWQIRPEQPEDESGAEIERRPLPTWVTGFGLQPGDTSVLRPAQCVGDLSASQPAMLPTLQPVLQPVLQPALRGPMSRTKPCGGSRWPVLYFMAPARAYSLWVWLCLGVLALGNGALASHWLGQREALQQAQSAQQAQLQRNARLSAQIRAQTSPQAAAAGGEVPGRTAQAAPSKEAAAAERAARQAAWRLAQEWRSHWQQVLLPLEQVLPEAGSLGWLALEHVAAQGEVRLSGAASAQAAMLGAVRVLSEQPGWSRVMLTRITPPAVGNTVAGPSGNPGLWSFELAARVEPTERTQPIDLIENFSVSSGPVLR